MWAVASMIFSEGYIPGALVLGERLRQQRLHGAKRVLLIVPGRFSRRQLELLAAFWDEVVPVEQSQETQNENCNDGTFSGWRNGHAEALAKIELWRLPYEKVLFLDADTLPRAPVADLLAVDFAPDQIVAAPDAGCPDTFNSGVFVLRPSRETHEELTNEIRKVAFGATFLYDGGDQALLNAVFNPDPSWPQLAHWSVSQPEVQPQRPRRWVQIPYLFNTAAELQGPVLSFYASAAEKRFRQDVVCVHFVGPRKPWYGGSGAYSDEWWAAWNDVVSRGRSVESFETAFSSSAARVCNMESLLGEVKVAQLGSNPVFVEIEDSEVENVPIEPESAAPSVAFKDMFEDLNAELQQNKEQAVEPPGNSGSELCDPAKYIEAFGPTPQEASWDATREEPPQEPPKNETFAEDLKAYRTQWSESHEIQEPAVVEEVKEAPRPAPEIIEEHEKAVPTVVEAIKALQLEPPVENLSIFHNQVAERVFDRSDYVPMHSLLQKKEPKKVEVKPEEKIVDTESEAEEIEAEEEEAEEEPMEVEDDEAVESPEPVRRLAPIFPWELRPAHAPERTFD
ncbi:uncharacterized protein CXQ87_002234 [Candidozyma duobushaemuli]|uniref:Glycogenin glucosyltransferase n=2 Tax=Candidozyma TaxID=3303203 RepID=A0ABX8I357_9ASCO|nr:uncharacterized protein CXQ87_002234 [[Candida] duobushaemulonis]PVH14109.1 hypothetical protein CXQ87_002234 [[Candida] duobushaemulonis]QWU87696.1 hypothetical protein CA3LBN_001961 [[Candida] haemuloni]